MDKLLIHNTKLKRRFFFNNSMITSSDVAQPTIPKIPLNAVRSASPVLFSHNGEYTADYRFYFIFSYFVSTDKIQHSRRAGLKWWTSRYEVWCTLSLLTSTCECDRQKELREQMPRFIVRRAVKGQCVYNSACIYLALDWCLGSDHQGTDRRRHVTAAHDIPPGITVPHNWRRVKYSYQ